MRYFPPGWIRGAKIMREWFLLVVVVITCLAAGASLQRYHDKLSGFHMALVAQ
jgi:hypothetical protein